MIGRRSHGVAAVAWLVMAFLLGGCAWLGFETADSVMKEGEQLYQDKKYDEAIAKFERAIELDSTRWMAYVYIARCYMAKGGWAKAVSNARLAYQAAPAGAEVVPTLAQALWGGGMEALKSGQFREAISALTEYLRLQPSDASAYLELGRAFMQSGNIPDAVAAFGKALELNPSQSEAADLLRGLR
jgi:tetratricopeptide (TPR) repeat protein